MRHPSPHPPHCHPPPLPPQGVPPQIRGHSCAWEFLPKKRKTAGVPFLKTEKTQGGGTRFGRGFRGEFLKTGKCRGGTRFGRGFMWKNLRNGKSHVGALKKTGKTQEGVPVSEGGLSGNFEEREKRRLEPVKNRKKLRRGYPFGRGFMGKFGIKKISYYICGKE